MIGLADVTIYPIPDQKGNIFQIAITARDITERIKGEQELHTSHKMISALMNAPTDVILFLDLDGKAILANQNLFNKLKLPPKKSSVNQLAPSYPQSQRATGKKNWNRC